MNKNTYWMQAQENEDREQEAYLAEYRKRKEGQKPGWLRRLFLSVREWVSQKG